MTVTFLLTVTVIILITFQLTVTIIMTVTFQLTVTVIMTVTFQYVIHKGLQSPEMLHQLHVLQQQLFNLLDEKQTMTFDPNDNVRYNNNIIIIIIVIIIIVIIIVVVVIILLLCLTVICASHDIINIFIKI